MNKPVPKGLSCIRPLLQFVNMFYSGLLRRAPPPCVGSTIFRAYNRTQMLLVYPLLRKEHRRFEGELGSLRSGFFPPTAEPLMYVLSMLPHTFASSLNIRSATGPPAALAAL
jgi:hypothetical protein